MSKKEEKTKERVLHSALKHGSRVESNISSFASWNPGRRTLTMALLPLFLLTRRKKPLRPEAHSASNPYIIDWAEVLTPVTINFGKLFCKRPKDTVQKAHSAVQYNTYSTQNWDVRFFFETDLAQISTHSRSFIIIQGARMTIIYTCQDEITAE